MDNRKQQVDEILESLSGMSRAEAPGFFYTRLKARMLAEGNTATKKQSAWLLRPAFMFCALTLLLLLNLAVFLQKNSGNEVADNDRVQTIAAEYSLPETNSLYDLALEK